MTTFLYTIHREGIFRRRFVLQRWEVMTGTIIPDREPLGVTGTIDAARAMLPPGVSRIDGSLEEGADVERYA